MDFRLEPAHVALVDRVRGFVEEHVLAIEADRSLWNEYENIKLAERDRLRQATKAAGLWAPQMPPARDALDPTGEAAPYDLPLIRPAPPATFSREGRRL